MKVGRSTRIRRSIEMFSGNSQYDRLMKTLENSLNFDKSDPAKFRLHVLEHYYIYGWKQTTEAFKVGKSTLYDWKREYESSGKALLSLVPKKTRPKRVRQMTTDWRLAQFIREFREQYGNIGERKLKIFLDEYAKELDLPLISSRTISKIIKRKNLYFNSPKKSKRKNKFSRDRTRKSPKINGVVERFNRTIQEEFINRNDEIYFDLNAFQVKLSGYLDWYNNKRPHASLGYLSPMQFINNSFPKSMCD